MQFNEKDHLNSSHLRSLRRLFLKNTDILFGDLEAIDQEPSIHGSFAGYLEQLEPKTKFLNYSFLAKSPQSQIHWLVSDESRSILARARRFLYFIGPQTLKAFEPKLEYGNEAHLAGNVSASTKVSTMAAEEVRFLQFSCWFSKVMESLAPGVEMVFVVLPSTPGVEQLCYAMSEAQLKVMNLKIFDFNFHSQRQSPNGDFAVGAAKMLAKVVHWALSDPEVMTMFRRRSNNFYRCFHSKKKFGFQRMCFLAGLRTPFEEEQTSEGSEVHWKSVTQCFDQSSPDDFAQGREMFESARAIKMSLYDEAMLSSSSGLSLEQIQLSFKPYQWVPAPYLTALFETTNCESRYLAL